MLLYRLTNLDPDANYDFVRDLLEKMRQKGAYIAVEGAGHPHEAVYTIDLAADVQLIIQRRMEGFLKDPGFTFGRAMEMLHAGMTSKQLPLASLASAPRSTRRVSWQKTRREGFCLYCRGEDDPLVSEESLNEIHEKLMATELDFCILIMAPQAEAGDEAPRGLLGHLRERGAKPYIVWTPQPVVGEQSMAFIPSLNKTPCPMTLFPQVTRMISAPTLA